MSLQRVPLQEYSNTYNQITETPTSKSYIQNSAITTPPETTTHFRKKRLSIETPITKNNMDLGSTTMLSSNLLLSPAFSSPQQQRHHQPSQLHHVQYQQPQSQYQQQNLGMFHQPNMYASSNLMVPPSTTSIQQPNSQLHYNPLEIAPPPKPSFDSESSHNSTISMSSHSHQQSHLPQQQQHQQHPPQEQQQQAPAPKKKTKKSRKEMKESPFDLDSNDKPPYSYATLIGMSILSNPDKKLTLSQIYQWISDTFKYYKSGEVGWQNSIRHNLSLNKAFHKGEKSKDGKGHFWFIQEGCEEQFLKSRSSKKQSYQEIIDQISNKPANNKAATSVSGTKASINSLPSSPNISHDVDDENSFSSSSKRSFERVAEYHNSKNAHSAENDDDEENDGDAEVTAEDIHVNGSLAYTEPKRQIKRMKLTPNDGNLGSLSNLGAPFLQWNDMNQHEGSSHGHSSGQSSTGSIHNSHNAVRLQGKNDNDVDHASVGAIGGSTPNFLLNESPNKPLLAGKNLTYTSSFSCNSNLELSPIRPSETGPLLEPLTPVNNIYKSIPVSIENHHPISQLHANLHYHINQQGVPSIPSSIKGITNTSSSHSMQQLPIISLSQSPMQGPSTSQSPFHTAKTPKSQQQRQQSHLPTSHIHLLQPHNSTYVTKTPKSSVKTPLRSLRSPQTSSILKKLCYSPSYIDDFYYSPLVSSAQGVLNSYDDDDLVSRAFESPAAKRLHATISSSRKLFGELKKVELISSEELGKENASSSTKQDSEKS